MFGEDDSESPRVGSPWDSLISNTPPKSNPELEMDKYIKECLPKLVPEVEYGNVEYKLRLINPSQERFTRLVTQMKWRLLEGGGQAYYELGVADSGQLIGLSRRDLEQSLETLEMMAGEIGASVIIVKEIEIPAALVGRFMNSALGIPERTPNRQEFYTGLTETSTTEDDDGVETPPSDGDVEVIVARQTQFRSTQHPALSYSDFEIEIASVYKPRPHRTRPVAIGQSRHGKRGPPKQKQQKVKNKKQAYESRNIDANGDAVKLGIDKGDISVRNVEVVVNNNAIEAHTSNAQGTVPPPSAMPDIDAAAPVPITVTDSLVPALEAFSLDDTDKILGEDNNANIPDMTAVATLVPGIEVNAEPRLIVEALVVRKLALEEAFLDFGGFALEI
ncbi:hypothetical protein M422DRAFT_32747 [Sphaerobolus stellatus SS14]|uniref:GTP-binding protein 2 n=1 Tax=Sphaerobolus stellatus (strain SS14) TaxID=990650 RepID=A0A0C9VDP2_SPHS4|nr:hypothetical protein M422DRAFT_32747 [Sphaerobolus stellatus SS14]